MPTKPIPMALELPEEIHALMEECANRKGLSVSRYIACLVISDAFQEGKPISLRAENFERFIQAAEQKKDVGKKLKRVIQALDRDGF